MTADLIASLLVDSAVFSALFLAMLLVRRLFHTHLSAFLRYALWAAVAVKLLLPFGFESPIGLMNWLPPAQAAAVEAVSWGGAASPGEQPLYMAGTPSSGMQPGASGNAPAPSSGPQTARSGGISPRLSLTDWAAMLWAAGAASTALWLLLCLMRLIRRISRGSAAVPAHIAEALEECRGELGIKRRVRVRMGPEFGVPGIAGLFRPVLLLPADSAGCDGQELRHVMLHELAHLKHGDLIVIHLMNLLTALYWFNPFVWLCFRIVRRDMETLCDQRALRLLGREQRVGYVETVLRYSGLPCCGRLHAALRMGAGRAGMEMRIREMLRKQRSDKGVRMAAALIAAAMLASGLLTACQPTPAKAPVANKGGDRLEEKLKATATPGLPADTANAPVRYADSYAGADAGVTVSIDADVTAPRGSLPVIEVKPHAVSMEQIKAMAAALFHGAKACEPAGMTKSDVQDMIVELKKRVADDAALLKYYDGSREQADLAKAEYQKQIAAYEAMLPSAPGTAVQKETDWAFHPDSYYTGAAGDPSRQTDQYFIAAGMFDGYHAFLQAGNIVSDDYESHFAGFTLGKDVWDQGSLPKWRFADDKPGGMTRSGAIALAADAVERMGLGQMRLVGCTAEQSPKIVSRELSQREALALAATYVPRATEPPENQACSYFMTFAPEYEGIPVLETGRNVEKDRYGPAYSYERLTVRVRNGLVTDLDWQNPLEAVRVENANVAALTLEQAAEAFKRQMQLAYTLDYLSSVTLSSPGFEQYKGRIESGSIRITDIRLGLMRIRVKDRPDAYRLVPAWMFTGREELKVEGVETPVAGMRSADEPYVFAVINAVDGSVIDPGLGY